MLNRQSVAAVLLLAFLGAASARPIDEPAVNAGRWAHDVVDALKEWSNGRLQAEIDVSHLGADLHRGDSQFSRFYLLVKYIIKPSVQKEFIGKWLAVRKEAEHQKGAIQFQLSKPLTDNLVYYSYQEWESKEDFADWLKEEDTEVKRLAEYITKEDIALVLTELKPAVPYNKPHHHGKTERSTLSQPMRIATEMMSDVTDTFQAWLDPAAAQSVSHEHHTKDHHPKGALLIKYIVRPSILKEFVEAVAKVTEQVKKHEPGNVVYGLSKTLTDDVTLYTYAVWEDKEAVEHHLKAEYSKELIKFIISHDILFTSTILFPIGSSPA